MNAPKSELANRVFVYGSLKQGFHNHYWLGNSVFVKSARTNDAIFSMINLGEYPAVFTDGNAAIDGELYLVNNEVLAQLDRLEENGSVYQRQLIQLAGDPEPAWMYLYLDSNAPKNINNIVYLKDSMETPVLSWGME